MHRVAWLAALVLHGCAVVVDEVCVHDPPLTYDNFGKGTVEQFCTGCHATNNPPHNRNGAPVGVDFDYYEGVLTWYDRIVVVTDPEATADGPYMPFGGGMNEQQNAMFREWLQCDLWDDWVAYQTMLYNE